MTTVDADDEGIPKLTKKKTKLPIIPNLNRYSKTHENVIFAQNKDTINDGQFP
jgi:hypothetical protein